MAVGRGSLKRLNTAAKAEIVKTEVSQTVPEAAKRETSSQKEACADAIKEKIIKGSVSKIVCTLPDYLL